MYLECITLTAIVSLALGTKLELSLIISGIRCVVQLSLMVSGSLEWTGGRKPGLELMESFLCTRA
jgi:hypothetical protein